MYKSLLSMLLDIHAGGVTLLLIFGRSTKLTNTALFTKAGGRPSFANPWSSAWFPNGDVLLVTKTGVRTDTEWAGPGALTLQALILQRGICPGRTPRWVLGESQH